MSASNCDTCGEPWPTHGTACKPVEFRSLVPAAGSVALRAARYEIEQAISRLETVEYRLEQCLKSKDWTRRMADAEIIALEVIPMLRRAMTVMPPNDPDQRPAT